MCENGIWMQALNTKLMRAKLYQTDCDNWTCAECGKRKTKLWQLRAWAGVEQYIREDGVNTWHMVTLTAREYRRTTEQGIEDFKAGWPRLYARMKRVQPTVRFIAIPELHKDSAMHMHVLTDFCRDKTYAGSKKYRKLWRLKDAAHGAGLGYIVDNKPLENVGGAVRYVTKYISKSLEFNDWPTKFRRVRASNDWPMIERHGKGDPDWVYTPLEREPGEGTELMLNMLGYRVSWAK